jgi:hypothetical protein
MVDKVPAMLDAVFECTLQMISRDFQARAALAGRAPQL